MVCKFLGLGIFRWHFLIVYIFFMGIVAILLV